MYGKMKEFLAKELADIKAAGLYKNERIITTPQRADIKVNDGEDVLNFCANNYLGLSDNQRLINAAKEAMDTHGFGMSSVRFICGTLYFMQLVLMLTVVCSNRCLQKKMLLFQMR
jgi:glycine C-acetyltransferase